MIEPRYDGSALILAGCRTPHNKGELASLAISSERIPGRQNPEEAFTLDRAGTEDARAEILVRSDFHCHRIDGGVWSGRRRMAAVSETTMTFR